AATSDRVDSSPVRPAVASEAAGASPRPEGSFRVDLGDERSPVVAKSEPVAGRLGGAALAEPLPQIPVHPLVAIQEAQDLARRPEVHALGEPQEPDLLAGSSLGAVRDDLAKGEEGLRDLQDDLPRREV